MDTFLEPKLSSAKHIAMSDKTSNKTFRFLFPNSVTTDI